MNEKDRTQRGPGSQENAGSGMQATGATQDKEAQRRGGEHSHSGTSGSSQGGSNQPRGAAVDKEAQRKGGQHSHGGR